MSEEQKPTPETAELDEGSGDTDPISVLRDLTENRGCSCGGWTCARCKMALVDAQKIIATAESAPLVPQEGAEPDVMREEIADRARHRVWELWNESRKSSRSSFGTACYQSFVRDAISQALTAYAAHVLSTTHESLKAAGYGSGSVKSVVENLVALAAAAKERADKLSESLKRAEERAEKAEADAVIQMRERKNALDWGERWRTAAQELESELTKLRAEKQ